MFQKILINKERKYYVKSISQDFHTQDGVFMKKDMKKAGNKVSSNSGKEFSMITPSFIDLYYKLKRGPQIMTKKDIGLIITETGIGKNSIIVDAGGGTGALAIMLGNIAKKVTVYEIREDFAKLVNENIEFMELDNVTVKNKDVNEIDEKNLDLVTLDLPEPWKAVKNISSAIKPGGFLVSYNPNLTQVVKFLEAVEKIKELIYLKTIEIIKRDWEIDEQRLRPANFKIGHTGFLTFVRKI